MIEINRNRMTQTNNKKNKTETAPSRVQGDEPLGSFPSQNWLWP